MPLPSQHRTNRPLWLFVFVGAVVALCGCAQKEPPEVAKASAPQPAPEKVKPKSPPPKSEPPKADTPAKANPPTVQSPGPGAKLPPKKDPPERRPKKFELEKFPPLKDWGEVKPSSRAWVVLFPEEPRIERRRYETPGGAIVETDEASLKREFTSGCVFLVRDDQFDRRPTTEEFELDNKAMLARASGIYGFPVGEPKATTLKTDGHFTRDYAYRSDTGYNFDVRRVLVIGKDKVRIITVLVGGPAVRDEDRKQFVDSLTITEKP